MMLLIEQGRVKLDAPVQEYIAEFTGQGRELITVRQLMTHTSGMKPDLSMKQVWTGYDTAIKLICETPPDNAPDKKFRYSDINFILLGEIVHRASGETLDAFAKKHVFEPLGMKDTAYNPSPDLRPRIAATEKDEKGVMLIGVVHDPTARRMGGVAGHAGLFSTAADLARYARMILNDGALDGVRLLKLETVKLMEAIHTPTGMTDKRALGWDVDTRYSKPRGGFPVGTSFGHTGFTGTCLWIDPGSRSFYVYLSSRLHETDRTTDHRKLYEKLGAEVAKAVLK
jgi:CubicO group peptidase (beta-lactamase class C family)